MQLIDGSKLKEDITAWGKGVVSSIKGKAPALTQLRVKVGTKYGVPAKISFSFPKHYIYREKGVGRGRKIGSGKETPKPDINQTIESNLPELAKIAGEGMAEIVAKNLFAK